MDINFKLDFFYYNELPVLDGRDPKMIELTPHIDKFKTFLATQPLDKIIELLVFTYKDKYAQTQFWTRKLLVNNSRLIDDEYPPYLDEDTDKFLSADSINRNDLKHFICKMILDLERGCYFSNYIEFAFMKEQNINKFKEAVERSLNGKQYQILQSNGEITFKVENSPIAKVEITNKKVKTIFNPEKWIAYYGLG
ncbi:hypothetical protein BA768_04755 [Chryseobacterium sp. CBo1]|uniref:hypothetical protein n=1 Tax=Chryseobacterium sp. CBo1 TaxID=1869230 RepID=UPI00081058F5|nr:hypothetical protein [Chryseobacterium sp. CBo1]OCK50468.1 hypothetical protein BA768_04755 [Chryseobacterium sp. CBo1]